MSATFAAFGCHFVVFVVVFVFVVVLLFGSHVAYMLYTVCEGACYFDMSLQRLSTHIPNSHCVAYIYCMSTVVKILKRCLSKQLFIRQYAQCLTCSRTH